MYCQAVNDLKPWKVSAEKNFWIIRVVCTVKTVPMHLKAVIEPKRDEVSPLPKLYKEAERPRSSDLYSPLLYNS